MPIPMRAIPQPIPVNNPEVQSPVGPVPLQGPGALASVVSPPNQPSAPIPPEASTPPPIEPQQPKAERDMRTEVTEADKEPVQELAVKGLQMLHSEESMAKLEQGFKSGAEPVLTVSDIIDDVLMALDAEVGPIPFAQLVLLGVILLTELNGLIAEVTGNPIAKDTMKLALMKALENTVGKEQMKKLETHRVESKSPSSSQGISSSQGLPTENVEAPGPNGVGALQTIAG